MTEIIAPTNIAEISGAIAVALIAVAMGIQKIVKSWKETGAETNIITLMNNELERMAKQNVTLSVELNKLQVEIINLNAQLRELSLENQRLHQEVTTLTLEVSRLQTILQKNADSKQ